MLIYSVNLVAAPGKAGQLAPLMGELRDVLTADTGQAWTGWWVPAGASFGSFVVSTAFENLAAMTTAQGKSIGSERFAAIAAKYGDLLAAPAETALMDVIGGTGEASTKPKPFVNVTRSTMAVGHMRQAIEWSMKIMQHVTDVTGVGGLVGTSLTGRLFQIGWLAGYDSPTELDDSNSKLAADPLYLELIDQAGDLFIQGTADRRIIAQLP
jgi:hypothetical protein